MAVNYCGICDVIFAPSVKAAGISNLVNANAKNFNLKANLT
jgi:hypothetical protein